MNIFNKPVSIKRQLGKLLLTGISVLFFLSGCNQPFNLADALGVGSDLNLSPSAIQINTGATINFSANGGIAPYTFSLQTSIGGVGEDLTGSTYTAPDTPGSALIRVTDAEGNYRTSTVSVVLPGGSVPLFISPSSISLNAGNSIVFAAAGGSAPYSFSLLTPIGGTGESLGAATYTAPDDTAGVAVVRVTDNIGATSDATINVSVPAPIVLNINPTSINLNLNDVINFSASGGVPPYSYTLFTPISGTDILAGSQYTAPTDATGNATVRVTDSIGATADAAINVSPASSLTISPAAIALDGDDAVMLSATGGVPPYSYSLFSAIVGTGEDLTGATYTAPSDTSGTATVRVTDAEFNTSDSTITVTIAAVPALVISPISVNLNLNDIIDFSASGGVPPYSYTLFSPISGTDTLVGAQYTAPSDGVGIATVQVTDNVGTTDDATINVTPAAALTIGPVAVSVTTGDSFQFTGYDGVPPYTFAVTLSGSGTPSVDAAGLYQAGSSAGTDNVRITDNDGATATAVVTVTNLSTNVNYDQVLVSNVGGTVGGGALAGEFTFRNNGTANGTQTVDWVVYASLDQNIGVGDQLIDSGTTAALNSGVTTPVAIPFSGIWPNPVSDTTYYLIAEVDAVDDLVTADNSGDTPVAITVAASSDVDYMVPSITNLPPSAEVGTAISQSFTIRNQGSSPGASSVFWTAYVSLDSLLDGGDQVVDSGVESPLANGTTSSAVPITGNWPATSGIYYLIIKVISGDDINPANDIESSAVFTINATATDIDYIVTGVSRNYPTVTTGSLLAETFNLANIGGLDGTQGVDWTAYASGDMVLDGGDIPLGSGTTFFSGLNAGASYSGYPVSGMWPGASGTYYLIVEVASGDETIPGNNTATSGPFSVKDPPDYSITSSTFQTDGVPGNPMSDFGTFDFTISEMAGANGSLPISWEVFVSTDTVLDMNDVSVKSGNIPALTAGGNSGVISFADAVWPNFGSYYNIIVTIQANDDGNGTNNFTVSPTVTVPELFTEGLDSTGSGPTAGPLAGVTDMDVVLDGITFDLFQLVKISDAIDVPKTQYDTYRFTLGAGVTVIDMYAEWTSSSNTIELYFWDEFSGEWSSTDFTSPPSREPTLSYFTIPGLTPGGVYYVGVEFRDNPPLPETYDLYVRAR